MKTFKKGHRYVNKNPNVNGLSKDVDPFCDSNVDDWIFSQYEDVTEKEDVDRKDY